MTVEHSQKQDYLPDQYLTGFTERYNVYQQRYAEEPREGDKVLIQLVKDAVSARGQAGLTVLDIGCSTGNLLAHLRQRVPGLTLVGGDLSLKAIEACRANPRLDGITFEVMDSLKLPPDRFDIVITNAVTYFFSPDEFERAVASIARALRPGGRWLSYDFAHPFEQHLRIVETSRDHPDGLNIYFRPYSYVRRLATAHGFADPDIRPFAIPIDLPRTGPPGSYDELNTYTVTTATGERQLFRGTLFQPWCHLSTVKVV